MNHLPEGSFKDSPSNKECLNVPELSEAILLTGIDGNVTSCIRTTHTSSVSCNGSCLLPRRHSPDPSTDLG